MSDRFNDLRRAIDGRMDRRRFLVTTGALGLASATEVTGTAAAQSQGGELEWEFQIDDTIGHSSPTVVDGTVYVGAADERLYAVDTTTGDQEWAFETEQVINSSPTVANGTVYVGSFDDHLYAVNAATGVQEWAFKTGDGIFSSPTVADGTVYVGSLDNHLYAVDAMTGDKDWDFETGDALRSSPTVDDNTVYIGSSDETLYAVDVTTGELDWDFETDGAVSSSPTVADGTVYVGSFDDHLYAVDASTGAREWDYPTGDGIFSSPTVADGTVYVGSYDHSLYAVDAASGDQQWASEFDNAVVSSPTVVGDIVFVGSMDDTLYAVDAATGDQVWAFHADSTINSSPTVVDGTVYVGSWDDTLYAVNAGVDGSSGDSRVTLGTLGHHHEWADQQDIESGTVTGTVTDTDGDPLDGIEVEIVDSVTTEIEATRTTDDNGEYTVSLLEGTHDVVVETEEFEPFITVITVEAEETHSVDIELTPYEDDSSATVYVGTKGNRLYAVDVATGEEEWAFTGPSWSVHSSPTVVGGTVYVGSRDNNLYAVDEETGEEEWAFTTWQAVRSSPTVVDGTVYVGSFDNRLYAVDAETGEEEWAFRTDDEVWSSPTVVAGTVYVGSNDGTLYAVDAATGEQEWAFTEPSWHVGSSPTVVGGTVYVGSRDDTLYAVDTATGEQKWAFTEPSGSVRSSPTVVDGIVYVGSNDETLYAVDAATGEQKWAFTEPSGPVRSSPTVVDGIVYVGSFDETLYAVDTATGEQEWAFTDPSDRVVSSPTVVRDSVAGSSVDSRVLWGTLGHHHEWADSQPGVEPIDDVYNGEEVWRMERSTGLRTPTVVDDVVFSVAGANTAVANARTGERLGGTLTGHAGTGPTVREETFYGVGGFDNDIIRAYEAGDLDQSEPEDIAEYELESSVGAMEVGEDHVYVVTRERDLYALDRDLEAIDWDYGDLPPRDGRSPAEPVYADGRVIVAGGHDTGNEGWIHVLDAETGALEWSDDRDTEFLRATVEDGTVYCLGLDDDADEVEILRYDLETGDLDVFVPEGVSNSSVRAPTVAHGVLYFVAGSPDSRVIAIEDDTVAWESDPHGEESSIAGHITVADGTVLAGTSGGGAQLLALDADTGELEWITDPDQELSRYTGMIVVGGMLFVAASHTDDDDLLIAANAGVTGSSVDSNARLGSGHHHEPAGSKPPAQPYILPLERPDDDETDDDTDDDRDDDTDDDRDDDTDDDQDDDQDDDTDDDLDDDTDDDRDDDTDDDRDDDTDDDQDDDTDDDGLPGFGVASTIASLGGMAYLVRQRFGGENEESTER